MPRKRVRITTSTYLALSAFRFPVLGQANPNPFRLLADQQQSGGNTRAQRVGRVQELVVLFSTLLTGSAVSLPPRRGVKDFFCLENEMIASPWVGTVINGWTGRWAGLPARVHMRVCMCVVGIGKWECSRSV